MNDPMDPHRPTAAFRGHLEQQLVRELLRGSRGPRFGAGRARALRQAAILLLTLGVGVAGGALSAQVQDNRQRDSLLVEERAELDFARQRVELARARLAEVRRRYEVGAVGAEELADAEAEVHRLASRLAAARLDIEEIQAAARPPRDDLSAPQVNERDFVAARLELGLAAAQQRMLAAERTLESARARFNAGQSGRLAVLDRTREAAEAQAELGLLTAKLALRQRYLAQDIAAPALARQLQLLEEQRELQLAQQLHEISTARLADLQARRNAGMGVDQVELLRSELQVAELKAQIERIRSDLEILRRSTPN